MSQDSLRRSPPLRMLGPEHAGAGQAGSGEREGWAVRPVIKAAANVQEHEEEKQEPLFLNISYLFSSKKMLECHKNILPTMQATHTISKDGNMRHIQASQ